MKRPGFVVYVAPTELVLCWDTAYYKHGVPTALLLKRPQSCNLSCTRAGVSSKFKVQGSSKRNLEP